MYLLDTNVVSELRKPRPDPHVREWLQYTPAGQLHLSAITVAEIQRGIEAKRARDPAKAREIERWLEDIVLDDFHVLAFSSAAAREWARLMQGRSAKIAFDAMIGAIASVHGLTVVTRNVRDFRRLGVPTFNPFESGG